MFSAVNSTALPVLRVSEITGENKKKQFLDKKSRVVGRVVEIFNNSRPLKFSVTNPTKGEFLANNQNKEALGLMRVSYNAPAPDTFQIGRDVILEGTLTDEVFLADSLMTQCPSKYEKGE